MTQPDPIRGAHPSDPAEGPAPDDDANSPAQQRDEVRANSASEQPPLEDSKAEDSSDTSQ